MVAVAAFTSILSCPSSSYLHQSVRRSFGFCNNRFHRCRCLHSQERKSLNSKKNSGTILSPGRTYDKSVSTTSREEETTPVSSLSRRSSTTLVSKSKCQKIRAKKSLENLLSSSRLGLDPSLNRFHAPLVYHEGYSIHNWPPKHTFPMMKFERTAHALQTTTSKIIPTSNLPRPIVRSKEDFFQPPDFSEIPICEWLDLLNNQNHDNKSALTDCDDNSNNDDNNDDNRLETDFGRRFLRRQLTREEARIIGFREQAHRPELVERTVLEVAGTVLTAQLALKYGIASNLAGGTHHAHPTGGAGYTILNDLAITGNLLTMPSTTTNHISATELDDSLSKDIALEFDNHDGLVDRVLVIDCDVHQGDGTAQYSTLWKNDRRFFTLSIHCESNYPFLKQNSTYDVGLSDRCDDQEYLIALKKSVNRAIREVLPDLVLYDAGVDVYTHDTLGRLDLTEENGIRQRDRWILDRCVSSGIPVAAVVGGGYDKDIDALGRRHAIVHEECAYIWRKYKLWRR